MKKLLLLAALALGTAAQAQQNGQGFSPPAFSIQDQGYNSATTYYRLQDTFSFGSINLGDSIVLDSAYLAAWTAIVPGPAPGTYVLESVYRIDTIYGCQLPFSHTLRHGNIVAANSGSQPIIQPSAGERFTLKFRPTAAGTFTDSLRVDLTETRTDYSTTPPTNRTYQYTAIMVLRGTVVDPTGLVQAPAQPLVLSPNPTKGILSWNTDLPLTSLRIVDMQGREVLQQNNLTEQVINVSSLPNGLYILHGQNEQGRFVQKFIKE